jgi:hypothetical protein
MSHFTVCLRVPGALVAEKLSIDAAVAAMLQPYQENNMGDCPKDLLTFNDVTAEHESKYATDTCNRVRLANGETFSAYDDRFRNKNRDWRDPKSKDYVYPDGAEKIEVPVKDVYSLDEYISDYCGYRKDESSGRYGYWENPNAKWDWWTIGGRWTGFFPVRAGVDIGNRLGKPGTFGNKPDQGKADVVRLSEIDFDSIGTETQSRALKFWDEWQRLIAGEKFDSFDGPRSKAMSIGLLDVNQGELTADEASRCLPWANSVPDTDSRHKWHDVYKIITKEAFLRDYLATFNPIATFATLDETGWREAGKMGWFGMSSDTPESYLQNKNSFADWMRAAPADAWLVVVDCHI